MVYNTVLLEPIEKLEEFTEFLTLYKKYVRASGRPIHERGGTYEIVCLTCKNELGDPYWFDDNLPYLIKRF